MIQPELPQQPVKWYYRPWVVLLMLFVILGPLGLPLLYKSPRFNRTWKIILTILSIASCVYLAKASVDMARGLSDQIQKMMGMTPSI